MECLGLDWEKIVEQGSAYALSSSGKEAFLDQSIGTDLPTIQKKQAKTTQARAYIEAYPVPKTLSTLPSLLTLLEKGSMGEYLLPIELLHIYQLLLLSQQFQTLFPSEFPLLKEQTDLLHLLLSLADLLHRTVDETGEIRDLATPRLSRIRKALPLQKKRIQERMERWMRHHKGDLGEPLITMRSGRYVIPTLPHAPSHLYLIHGRSHTGNTLYAEPIEMVEENNRLRQLAMEEEEEIRHILRTTTQRVMEEGDLLKTNHVILVEIDVLLAKAQYSQALDGTEPLFNQEGSILLKGARHPLLVTQLGEKTVPTDLEVGGKKRILILSGPNRGGKSVALKTIGTLVAMAQAGFHIPAERGSTLPIVGKILVGLGDGQDLTQSLSTFSSHVLQLKRFLETADSKTLLLLDEIGTGTDPKEGSALAQAVLEALIATGAVAVVTTHYTELKALATLYPEIENASFEYTPSFESTYRVCMKRAGKSFGLEMAKRMDFPSSVLERAEEIRDGKKGTTEEEIERLEEKEKELQMEEERLRQKELDLEDEKRALIEREGDLQKRCDQHLQETEERINHWIRELQKNPSLKKAELLKKTLRTKRKERIQKRPPPKNPLSDIPQIGETVYVSSLHCRGVVNGVEKKERMEESRVEVQMGVLRATFPLHELEKSTPPPKVPPYSPPIHSSFESGLFCDLRGLRREEALEKVDLFLDTAYREELKEVEIIHGLGTGILKEAILEYLKESPYIFSYERVLGNDGVIRVHLKEVPSLSAH